MRDGSGDDGGDGLSEIQYPALTLMEHKQPTTPTAILSWLTDGGSVPSNSAQGPGLTSDYCLWLAG